MSEYQNNDEIEKLDSLKNQLDFNGNDYHCKSNQSIVRLYPGPRDFSQKNTSILTSYHAKNSVRLLEMFEKIKLDIDDVHKTLNITIFRDKYDNVNFLSKVLADNNNMMTHDIDLTEDNIPEKAVDMSNKYVLAVYQYKRDFIFMDQIAFAIKLLTGNFPEVPGFVDYFGDNPIENNQSEIVFVQQSHVVYALWKAGLLPESKGSSDFCKKIIPHFKSMKTKKPLKLDSLLPAVNQAKKDSKNVPKEIPPDSILNPLIDKLKKICK